MSQTQQEYQHASVGPRHVALLSQRLEAVLDESLDVLIEMLLFRVEFAVHVVYDTVRKVEQRLAVEDSGLCPSEHASVQDDLRTHG